MSEEGKSNGKTRPRFSLLFWFAALTALMVAIAHYG